MQKISIGIIGFNEEYGLEKLLDSLQEQNLLKGSYDVEIVVISNGSYDNMVSVAQEKLAKFSDLGVKSKVVELALADKCAAWNHFVHQVSDRADYYILLDADVVLVNASGLEEIITILIENPDCRICGGKIVNQKGEVTDRLADGKCYATLGDILRNIAIPNGVVSDDTYVVITAVTNWYETDFEQGLKKGYIRQSSSITVSYGGTPRDKNISYWIACRKRTLTSVYTQRQVDYCMRNIFGGGEKARDISMRLFRENPDWFLKFLNKDNYSLKFEPPAIHSLLTFRDILQYIVYCYCYVLSVKGIRNQEFGHLAWKLKSRYW